MNCFKPLIIFLLSSGGLFAQNLVNNASFAYGSSSEWSTILSVDFYPGTQGEVDQEGRVYTSDGNGCAGVRFYTPNDPNWQEYLYQGIPNEMQANTVYKVSVKYRLAPRCSFATDAMGIGFFTEDHITTELLQAKVPEIKNPAGHLLENNNEFHELTGYYTATGNEVYFVFGAFAKDDNMFRAHISLGPPYPNAWEPELNGDVFEHILYYVDEFSITACPDYPAYALAEQPLFCSSEMVELEVSGTSNTNILWSTGDTTSTVEVLADNQTIWVEVERNGCVKRDSVELRVFSGAFDLGDDKVVCASETPVLNVTSAPGETVLWNTGENTNQLTVQNNGDYWATKSLGNCSYTDTIHVAFIGDQTTLYPNPYGHTFSFSEGDEVMIKEIITEDGKYLFKGNESFENVKGIFEFLPSGQFYITTAINGCEIEKAVIKISVP